MAYDRTYVLRVKNSEKKPLIIRIIFECLDIYVGGTLGIRRLRSKYADPSYRRQFFTNL